MEIYIFYILHCNLHYNTRTGGKRKGRFWRKTGTLELFIWKEFYRETVMTLLLSSGQHIPLWVGNRTWGMCVWVNSRSVNDTISEIPSAVVVLQTSYYMNYTVPYHLWLLFSDLIMRSRRGRVSAVAAIL